MEISDFFIDENRTILDAMKQIDLIAKKVLFVTKKDQFVATLTDGDIRRWILRKGELSASIARLPTIHQSISMKTINVIQKNL